MQLTQEARCGHFWPFFNCSISYFR